MDKKYSFWKAFTGIYRTPATFAVLRKQGVGRAFFHFALLLLMNYAIVIGIPGYRAVSELNKFSKAFFEDCGGIRATDEKHVYPEKSPDVSRMIPIVEEEVISYIAPNGDEVTPEDLASVFANGENAQFYWTANAMILITPYSDDISYLMVKSFSFGGMRNENIWTVKETCDFINKNISVDGDDLDEKTIFSLTSETPLVTILIISLIFGWLVFTVIALLFKLFLTLISAWIFSLFSSIGKDKNGFSEVLTLAFYSWMPVLPLTLLLHVFGVKFIICGWIALVGFLLVLVAAVAFAKQPPVAVTAEQVKSNESKNE